MYFGVPPNAGCVDIFGRRSKTPSETLVVTVEGVETAIYGLKAKEDGNTVGLEGPRRDVKVLVSVSRT
jgi:hypothetical protein